MLREAKATTLVIVLHARSCAWGERTWWERRDSRQQTKKEIRKRTRTVSVSLRESRRREEDAQPAAHSARRTSAVPGSGDDPRDSFIFPLDEVASGRDRQRGLRGTACAWRRGCSATPREPSWLMLLAQGRGQPAGDCAPLSFVGVYFGGSAPCPSAGGPSPVPEAQRRLSTGSPGVFGGDRAGAWDEAERTSSHHRSAVQADGQIIHTDLRLRRGETRVLLA